MNYPVSLKPNFASEHTLLQLPKDLFQNGKRALTFLILMQKDVLIMILQLRTLTGIQLIT